MNQYLNCANHTQLIAVSYLQFHIAFVHKFVVSETGICITQSGYVRKISLKLFAFEKSARHTLVNAEVIPNQNPIVPGIICSQFIVYTLYMPFMVFFKW